MTDAGGVSTAEGNKLEPRLGSALERIDERRSRAEGGRRDVDARARREARAVHEEALGSRRAAAATVDVTGDLLGSSEVLGRVEEVTLLRGA